MLLLLITFISVIITSGFNPQQLFSSDSINYSLSKTNASFIWRQIIEQMVHFGNAEEKEQSVSGYWQRLNMIKTLTL